MSGVFGVSLGSTRPPATCTHTLMPMSAVAVLMVDESLVLVNSPVTAEGVINRVTPFRLAVWGGESSTPLSVAAAVGLHGGLRGRLVGLSVQPVGLTAA